MPNMNDIWDNFRVTSPSKIEEYLGRNPQLIGHLVAAIPVIRKHLPEAGMPILIHRVSGWEEDLMIHIPLPDSIDVLEGKRRLDLIDDEWWVPLPADVRNTLLADFRWNQ